MSDPFHESYRQLLSRYGVRVAAGARVSEEGTVPDRFWVVLSGRVAIHAEAASGRRSPAREVGPGGSVAVAEAVAGRPLAAGASAVESSELLAIPVSEALEAFRAAPELALSLLRELASEGEEEQTVGQRVEDLAPGLEPKPAGEQPAVEAPAEEVQRIAAPAGLVRLEGSYDQEAFFVDEARCPISGTVFQHLRTRARALRPIARDSDFRISYRGVNPTYYAVVVCPGCSFAAYQDDFDEVEPRRREALIVAQAQRDVFGRPNLCGERSADAAVLALTLARHCYEARAAGPRRRAGLLHRQAWLERDRQQYEAERRYLRDARAAYIEAFERDGDLSETAAVRAAYVIGDLALRLDDPREAGRWLETCLRMPELSSQRGLERMVRDRLSDVREQLERSDEAA